MDFKIGDEVIISNDIMLTASDSYKNAILHYGSMEGVIVTVMLNGRCRIMSGDRSLIVYSEYLSLK